MGAWIELSRQPGWAASKFCAISCQATLSAGGARSRSSISQSMSWLKTATVPDQQTTNSSSPAVRPIQLCQTKKVRRRTAASETALEADRHPARLGLEVEEPHALVGNADIFLVQQVRRGHENFPRTDVVVHRCVHQEERIRRDEAERLVRSEERGEEEKGVRT